MDAVDLDVESTFDIGAWLCSDEAGKLQRDLEERITRLLFSPDLTDLECRRMAVQLAWIGTESQSRALLGKEVLQLELSSDSEIVPCGWKWTQKVWKGTCNATSKTVNFISDHSTEIIIGAAICATGAGIAYVTGYGLSVAVSGVVVAGAGSIFSAEEKPNPHIPQHLPYPSKSELAVLEQPISALPDPELPHFPNEFLVTSKGIWANGQFYSNAPLMKDSLLSPLQSTPQMRGENSLALGFYSQALQEFNLAIAENPMNSTAYLQRGAAHFSLGEYERSLEDFEQFTSQVDPCPLSISEFSLGFAKGLPKGVYESGEGLFLFLSDFVTHPIHTSKQIVDSIATLVELVQNDEWGMVVEALSPEMHELVSHWNSLPSNERGELAGYAVGKHGADILIPGALAKVATKSLRSAEELAAVCKNLQIAQETLVLETAAGIGSSAKIAEVIEAGNKTVVLAEELGFAAKEMGQLKQAGTLEAAVAKKCEHLTPSMQESFALHKKAQETLKPYIKQFLPESTVRELIHRAGIETFPRPKGIPDNYLVRITEKGAGMEYVHPTNPHFSIRVMPGKPHSPNLCQQKPYVIQKADRGAFDKTGKPVLSDATEAHIPFDEFIFRECLSGD